MLVLTLVLMAFCVLATAIAVGTPAWESADEPGHVQNIEDLVSGHWYGIELQCLGHGGCTDELHQAPLYYLLLAGWQRAAGVPVHVEPYAKVGYLSSANVDYFIGHGGLYRTHSPADHRFLLWLRLPNVLLGAVTVLLTFLALRLVTEDPWTPVVGAAIVAFWPRFVFLSAFVTNDNLVDLLGAALVYAALRYARSPSRWGMVAVGVVLGLLVTTKLSALPMVAVVGPLALLVRRFRERAVLLAVGVGAAALTCSWYLIQNTYRYGDPLALKASARYLALTGGLGTPFGEPYRVTDPLRLIAVDVPRQIVRSLWYASGWNQFHWSTPVDLLCTAAFASAVVGLVGRRLERSTAVTLWSLTVLALVTVWVVAFQTATYQARYAFVGIAALAGLAALGLERWRLPIRFVLPLLGLAGTVIALEQNVLAVHW